MKKRCGLGFDCASMMLTPGIDPGDCLNYRTCGSASDLSPEEEFELYIFRQQEHERYQETLRVDRHRAAVLMLQSRGCPQTVETLGLVELVNQLANQLTEVQEQLQLFENFYIAPEGCEAHTYNVKRPRGVYEYHKLTAMSAIFEPSEKTDKVKVIHLSHEDDPRNLEARNGIDRRNKLTQVRTQLKTAVAALAAAAELLTSSSNLLTPLARTDETPSTGER